MDFLVKEALKTNEVKEEMMENIDVGQANIKVIGVGGAGNNMVDWLYKKGVKGS